MTTPQRMEPAERSFERIEEADLERLAALARPVRHPIHLRRAYGLRDEEYLRLKVLTCMLPAI